MVRGLGVDAVEIDRIRRTRERHGDAFSKRILSEREWDLYREVATPDQFLAGRFAAKEAVMKVLGTGWAKGVTFRDIEILRDSEGAPIAHLDGEAAVRARTLGMRRVLVSITHTRDLAIANAAGVA
jgi:holo-[acyl-carrier protein] synthase